MRYDRENGMKFKTWYNQNKSKSKKELAKLLWHNDIDTSPENIYYFAKLRSQRENIFMKRVAITEGIILLCMAGLLLWQL